MRRVSSLSSMSYAVFFHTRQWLLLLLLLPLLLLLQLVVVVNATTTTTTTTSDTDQSSSDDFSCPVVPTVTLHNGVEMPLLQLGTAHLVTHKGMGGADVPYNFTGILPERTYRQIQIALEAGIRAFDTALIYRSHTPMAHVLGEWYRTSPTNSRSQIWITTKIFHPDARHAALGLSHMPNLSNMTLDQVRIATTTQFEQCLLELNVGYIDLVLLHWPSEKNQSPSPLHRQRRIVAWQVLEEMYTKGWIRAIGVSNFAPRHIEQLLEDGATIRPMVNQIEASVTLQYTTILEYCVSHNIVPQAYSPFGRGIQSLPNEVQQMANQQNKYPDKTAGQIAIQYLLQLGYAVVYLSNSAQHMIHNSNVFDNFTLSESDMDLLRALHHPHGGWGLPSPLELE